MDRNLESVKCVICEDDNDVKIRKFKYDDLKSNLVLCKNCGLGYLNPRWKKEEYLNYYKSFYDDQYRPELKLETDDIYTDQENIILERFKKNNIVFSNSKAILDIGSGAGDNLMAFQNDNPTLECYAIEPSPFSQELLKKKNIRVISDDVDSDWDKEYQKKFDIVIMRHVLEHFLNPLEVLKKVRNVLKEDGILYIAVPNNLIEKRGEGWLRVAHTYYFNRFTFMAIINKASLKISSLFLMDQFNKLEIFAFVQKDEMRNDTKNIIDGKSYDEQKQVFSIVFQKKSSLNGIKNFTKKIISKFK